jgi:hypothetical protein
MPQERQRDLVRLVLGSHGLSERGDRLRGGLATADGAFHVAVPFGGVLCAGPVDAPDRFAPRLAVNRVVVPVARCE